MRKRLEQAPTRSHLPASARQQQGELSAALMAAEERRLEAERALTTSRDQQRRNRAEMAGDEAIAASTAVQAALAAFEQAAAEHDAVSGQLGAVSGELERLRLRFVPLSVALLIHLVAGLILLPQRRTALG